MLANIDTRIILCIFNKVAILPNFRLELGIFKYK